MSESKIEKFRSEFRNVNSKQIVIDENYQRQIDFNRVKKIIKVFNPNLINPIKVSFRDNKYYCFDGQHTLSVLKTMNDNKDLSVPCKVFYDMSESDEAKLFSEQNGIARSVATSQRLKSLYVAGDVDVVDFKKTVEDCGFKCDFSSGRGYKKLICYSTAFQIYCRYGKEQLTNVLNIIMKAWGGDSDSVLKEVVVGLDIFTRIYIGAYEKSNLIKRLATIAPVRIKMDGSAISIGGNKRYAIQILNIYNKNTSTKRLDYKF